MPLFLGGRVVRPSRNEPSAAPPSVVPAPPSQPPATTPSRRRHRHRVLNGRFCFGAASPSVRARRSDSAGELWSPSAPDRGNTPPVERELPGLFAVPNPPPASQPVVKPAPVKYIEHEQPLPAPEWPTCCICLEAIEGRQELKCPTCVMSAHAKCLSKWFESQPKCPKTTSAANAATSTANPASDTGAPRTKASCPSCRAALDWDKLVLESRAKRQPLSSMLARCNIIDRAAGAHETVAIGTSIGTSRAD